MSDHLKHMKELLRITLQVAVPLHVIELARRPFHEVVAAGRETADVVASKGDALQFGGRPGEATKAFNALALGLAALAYCPGGVTFLGDHWEAVHPEARVS